MERNEELIEFIEQNSNEIHEYGVKARLDKNEQRYDDLRNDS